MNLKRNYIKNPLKKGEYPELEDIKYLFLELNLSREDCAKVCNCNPEKVKIVCQKNNLTKTKEQRNELRRKTNLTKYGCINVSQNKDVKEKKKQTTQKHYGVENPAQSKVVYNRIKETNLDKHGVESTNSLESKKQKIRQTLLDKYGVNNAALIEEGIHKRKQKQKQTNKKIIETKRNNHSFNKSNPEDGIYKLLCKTFVVNRQYSSVDYPFACDFYLPEIDLYIEYNGTWTHGGFPFENNKTCLEQLERWQVKAKDSEFYKNAIETWTTRDVTKRQTAKNNKLNWIEFFGVKEFMEWYNNICEILK